MIVVFKNNDYKLVDLDVLADIENNVVDSTIPKDLMKASLQLYKICILTHRIVLASKSNLIPFELKYLERLLHRLGKHFGIKFIIYDNKERFDKFIMKPSVDGNMENYKKKVPSPKPSRIEFFRSKSYILPVYNTQKEIDEELAINKLIKNIDNLIVEN